MNGEPQTFGLSPEARTQLLNRIGQGIGQRASIVQPAGGPAPPGDRPALGDAETLRDIAFMRRAGAALDLDSPFFRVNAGHAGPWAQIDGRRVLSFCAYNYVGLNGDARVTAAAKAVADLHGTSVSGSRIVSGERPVHRALEAALASVYGAQDAVAFVGGHATNVTVIAHLVGPGDAVVHDSLAHNSIIQGAQLSGARRRSFQHKDLADLARVLADLGSTACRRLGGGEGGYGMDGDAPYLKGLIEVVRRSGKFGAQLKRLEAAGFTSFVHVQERDGVVERGEIRSLSE